MLRAITLLLAFHLVLLATTNNSLKAQTASEYAQIITRFDQWKALQYKNGSYASPKTCTLEIASADNYKGPDAGISPEISVYYTDINNDKKIDAVITFNPYLCGGGNALMNAEEKLLVLSKGAAYVVDETYFSKLEEKMEKGWLHINAANGETFFGIYYEYADDDGRCCPSVKKPFSIDYKTKKITFDSE